MKRHVVVVATSARESGAWRIVTMLSDLAEADHSTHYTFITVRPLAMIKNNINIVVKINNIKDRCIFELFKIRKLLFVNGEPPDLVLSLNNIAILGALGIKQYVYIHQAFPFYPEHRWSIWNTERTQLFYQKFYGLIMRISIIMTNSKLIVQTKTMAERVQKFWNKEAICWFPQVVRLQGLSRPPNSSMKSILFYPATLHAHKNHQVLIRAIQAIKEINHLICAKCLFVFTLNHLSDEDVQSVECIKLVGTLSHEEILQHYLQASVLLFPSVIETVGLPLVEAAGLGLPIICADTEYSREILSVYPGVTFLPEGDARAWAEAIINHVIDCSENPIMKRFSSYSPNIRTTDLADLE
ncbi:MAG: glycosyltransferase [Verrucomicrobiota bacterium]